MDKKIIEKGIAEAEKEAQQKQIDKIKNIVKILLTKIEERKKEEKKIHDERKLLEKDLDDLKAGRLDKIEERQKKDEKARDLSTIIVRKIEKDYIPYYPWKSPWYVEIREPSNFEFYYASCNSTSALTTDFISNSTLTAQGTDFQNFSKGSYEIEDRVINL